MKKTKTVTEMLIESINDDAEKNRLFWVAGLAKEVYPVLKDHLDELHPVAKMAVEHYIETEGK